MNLVLYVQSDFSIALYLPSHGKKDAFSGLIVKYTAVSMHGLKIIFTHALWHNKEISWEYLFK